MDEEPQFDLGESPPALKALGDSYRELVNMVIQTLMGLADNDVSLAHALASSAEARFRAVNHFNFVNTAIAAGKLNEPEDGKP